MKRPLQCDASVALDRLYLERALRRAEVNVIRPKKDRERLIKHLKGALIVLLSEEGNSYRSRSNSDAS